MTYRECYDAYLAVVDPAHTGRSIKGFVRDAGLLPLSCIPLLAYDNHGYSYPVYVDLDFHADANNGEMVLHLVGAPSGWRMSTLLAKGGDYPVGIALDFGLGWFCTNFQEVLDAVMSGIAAQWRTA